MDREGKEEARQRTVATAQGGVAGRVAAAAARVGFSPEQRSLGDGERFWGCGILVIAVDL